MTKIQVYNQEGKKQGMAEIPENLKVSAKPELIYQAYVYELSQKKYPTAHTKNKGEVRGSGRKPWRQKGTGRARAGSVRSPLWRGGGIIFGPTPERNFKKRIPKKQRKKAIKAVLSQEIIDKKVIVVSAISQKNIKTKDFEEKITKLPVQGTTLVILEKPDEVIQKSAKNIPYIKVITVKKINLTDLLKFDFIVIAKNALKVLGEE